MQFRFTHSQFYEGDHGKEIQKEGTKDSDGYYFRRFSR